MFDPEIQAYLVDQEDGSVVYLFQSRYYATKWIREHVPVDGQKMWKVFEIEGYFRVFRFIEYSFFPSCHDAP